MKEINIRDIKESPIELINDGWGLVTAGDHKKLNMMTVSWGGIGELWGKDVVFIFIRPQRYTYEFLENKDLFTLSFYSSEYRNALTVCGRKSGRDIDKCEETGLTPMFVDDAVSFKEARYTIVCRKIASQFMDPKGFIDSEIESNYSNNDYHKIYVGEILKVYTND